MLSSGFTMKRIDELMAIIRQLEIDKQHLIAIIKGAGLSVEQYHRTTARPPSLSPAPIPAAEAPLSDLSALQWTN
jgi:hypothetical protein